MEPLPVSDCDLADELSISLICLQVWLLLLDDQFELKLKSIIYHAASQYRWFVLQHGGIDQHRFADVVRDCLEIQQELAGLIQCVIAALNHLL